MAIPVSLGVRGQFWWRGWAGRRPLISKIRRCPCPGREALPLTAGGQPPGRGGATLCHGVDSVFSRRIDEVGGVGSASMTANGSGGDGCCSYDGNAISVVVSTADVVTGGHRRFILRRAVGSPCTRSDHMKVGLLVRIEAAPCSSRRGSADRRY